jgi:cytidylate kinase
MSKRFIIAIGREFGSGGKHVGRALAKELGVNLYDRNIIEKVAAELDVDAKYLLPYQKKKKRSFFHKTVNGHTTSFEDHVANMQFDYIRKLGQSDESFVIVGRCGEEILKDCDGLISIFVKGDREYRIGRVMKQFNLDRQAATDKMDRHDKTRKYYHDRYCNGKWGEIDTYDLCIDSTHFKTQGTAEFIKEYVKRRLEVTEE